MNFKEALIAHLQGEKVEAKGLDGVWTSLGYAIRDLPMNVIYLGDSAFSKCEFRLAPRTIFVNGVEVPALESVAPAIGDVVWIADPCGNGYMCYPETWSDHAEQIELLSRNLVHKTKEDAIARAKAMLLTSNNQKEPSVTQLADKMAEKRGYICQSVSSSRDGDKMIFTIECVKPNKGDA